jgi:hypothetical protein
VSRSVHAETDYRRIYCGRGLHVRDVLDGTCLECGDVKRLPDEHAELAANEPPPGSIVMSQGPTGTAWQRLNSTGRWHSVTGKSTTWAKLTLGDRQGSRTRIVYLPPIRKGGTP